jgi:hypothetical protein
MADIIDLTLVAAARRNLETLLKTRGLAYFLREDRSRPFQLEPKRVELVVRSAARARRDEARARPHVRAVDYARKEVRRELIRRVVREMLQTGM